MKKIIEVNRQLAGVEDFLWGDGTVTQTRGGKEVEVTRINAMEIPYGNITIGEAIAGGIQGLGIFTTSSRLVKSGSVSINRSTVSVPANKVIQVDDLILDAFSILGKVTTLEDDTITVEFYATVKGEKGDKGDIGDKGDKGDKGVSLHIIGTIDTINDLPVVGNVNDNYLVGVSLPRDLYSWDNATNSWVNQGNLKGDAFTYSDFTPEQLAYLKDDNNAVKLTGNQTIAGIKTFSSNIVGNITGNSGTATKLATARTINGVSFDGSANITVSDFTAVKLTENEIIAGIKTFTSSPIVPTPTTGTQAANKAYVDQSVLTKDFLAKVKTNQPTSNPIFGAVKGINILGDSITHGAFALNSFNHSWGRIFQKMANVDLQSKSYGVINFLSLGSGATETRDIHSVSFSGSWNASVNCLKTLIGVALSNSSVGDEINITIPSFQSNANLNYIKSTTGGTFELYINNTLHSTTNTAGTLNPYAFVSFPVTDNGKGQCNIKIKATVGTVEVSTIQYYKDKSPMINLFATSGRKLIELTDNTIELICANSSTLIMALGRNDTYKAELVSRIDKLINECNANNISLVIPDFRWTSDVSDQVRQELIRLHQNVPGSIYIPFPELFKNNSRTVDSTYIVSTLSLWTDGSHPNQKGNKLIAETIAKAMNFSVTSKEEANYIHNYVMPLDLNPSTTLENIGIVSSVKWDKSNIVVNCYVRMGSSGAFPIGTHIIQTAWPSNYEVPKIRQKWQGVAYIRNDTGAIVSIASLDAEGEIKLYVLNNFVTNQTFEFSVSVQ